MGEERPLEEAEESKGSAPDETGGASRVNEPKAGPIAKPHDPPAKPVDAKREDARKAIAYTLLGIFIAQLAFFGYAVFGTVTTWERAQEFMQVTLAGTLGLLGSAIGFYFGSQR